MSIFKIGDLVMLKGERRYGKPDSQGGVAYVTGCQEKDGKDIFEVDYILGMKRSKKVPSGLISLVLSHQQIRATVLSGHPSYRRP